MVALQINGQEIGWLEALAYAKFWGELGFLQAAADGALIRQTAARMGVSVSDAELQQAADEFRTDRELSGVEETKNWLAAHYLTYEEWESQLEIEVMRLKLREAITAGKVEQYFALNRLAFEAAVISLLVVEDEGVARELRAQIVDEGAEFHALAREHSIDEPTRVASGYRGKVRRRELGAVLQAAVFGGRTGELTGPVKSDYGWQLIMIQELLPAILNEAVREEIKSLLFNEWLTEQRATAQVTRPC